MCVAFYGLEGETLNLFAAMRRVLHLKMVTQCAMLEEFGIFLVLADKVRLNVSILRCLSSYRKPVVVRLSYRGSRTIQSPKRPYLPNTAKA